MKNLRKLVIASFMLVIAFVAVVSSTYAWFTGGNTATISDITIGVVDAEKSMLISKDGQTWSRSIAVNPVGKITPTTLRSSGGMAFQELDWDEDAQHNLIPVYNSASALKEKGFGNVDEEGFEQVSDVTSANFANYGRKLYVKNDSDEYVVATEYAENTSYYIDHSEDKGFVQFDIYFQITVLEANEWATTKINMDIEDLHAYKGQTAQASEVENKEAASCFRLAVVETGTAQNQTATLKQITEYNPTDTDGVYGAGDQFGLGNAWFKMLKDYQDANASFTQALAKEESATVYSLAADYADASSKAVANGGKLVALNYETGNYEYVLDTSANNAFVSETADGLTRTYKITVYVWMEGWDGDNINASSNVRYIFDLKFQAQ